jgi:hypothetical protein
MIRVRYEAIDGYRKTKMFKLLKNARKYAHERVGEHPSLGSYYAVSDDGVGKITANINLRELFPDTEVEVDPEDPEPQPPEWSGFDSSEQDDNPF